ncbi:HD domain-containing protein [Bdellovibrio sp. HCB337]|uniref:[protein-PII] uridylyltransferase family protein n=1 Tax=Bdellovibrio sp. HCB337 TaxID=3394358 RepID=UPI0039A66159
MSKTYLSNEQWEKANEVFPPVFWTPNGDVRFTSYFGGPQFASWLSSQLEEKLKAFPGFIECEPVILGSWSRGELCPISDIDILFCGPEGKVKDLTDRFHQAGLKVRYRVPKNPEDWTEGVESFDILSLWKAKPLSSEAASKLLLQQKRLWENKKQLRQSLIKDLLSERKQRASRYNSISNYLEPNLKYGPGGLRDIEQALQVYDLFSDKFQNPGHALSVLNYHKAYLLTLRQKLHLMGCGEVLVNTAQFDLAKFFNFKTHKDFMRDLERGLSRSHFYVNWIFQVASSSQKELQSTRELPFHKPTDLVEALKKYPNPLGQQKVRENLDRLLPEKVVQKNARWFGKVLQEMLNPKASKDFVVSVFESRLIDKILPAIRHLVGYVQHDQYHRYTADVHIMQACVMLKEIYQNPKALGPLGTLYKELTDDDWKILSWSALYHDLAKGMHSEDHSDLGVEILRKDFKKYGFNKKFTEEVAWMVKNHLELSIAAFRKNPKSKKTWEDLEKIGAKGGRLKRLAIFTVMDICATNPEAWNEWKGRLLRDLVEAMNAPSTQNYFSLKQSLQKKKFKGLEDLLADFDDFLLQSLSSPVLAQDLKKARESQESLNPLVFKKGKEIWVRFHSKKDQEGLLADYVQRLYSLGLGIRHASIQTLIGIGVYDWFQVSTSKNLQVIEKMLKNSQGVAKELPKVVYDQIEWVSIDDSEWILSFKGKDQVGFLSNATKALASTGLNIKSARVHTWGHQVNDIFILKTPKETPESLLTQIKEHL